MNKPSVILHLDGHCIKTSAHREFMHLVDKSVMLPLGTEDKELDSRIELLRQFLEGTDFPSLRAGDERLTGLKESWVRLSWDEDFILEISDEPIE